MPEPLMTQLMRVAVRVLAYGLGAAVVFAQAPKAPPSLERFTVTSDGHPMALWARRPAAPKGTVLLVHGRTWSSRPDFDLQVPGMQRSVLVSLAAHGFAAYAVDLRGYGETPRDGTGWFTPRRAAADLVNVLGWVAQQHPALPKPALVGWSRGAALAGMVAMNASGAMSALVLFGFAFDPDLQFVDGPASGKPLMEKNTAAAATADFISPNVTPPAVIQAFTQQALKADPILVDVKNDAEFNLFNPAKFFARIATGDKQMVVLPGADHAAQIEDTHEAWIAAVVSFLNRPAAKR
jgi:pimeloyl-ACP methyl ester carboxylesterase